MKACSEKKEIPEEQEIRVPGFLVQWNVTLGMHFFHIVDRRDKDTQEPVITKYVGKGSAIYSDKWGAYFSLNGRGYTHDTVNHSVEFKYDSGCCTNTIEGLWGVAKLRIKKKGVLKENLLVIVDEFMYRYRFGHENGDIFYLFIDDISEFRPYH